MPIRPALLLAGAAALAVSTPALAQDDRYAGVHADHHADSGERYDGQYDGSWEGEWDSDNTWHGEWTGTYTDAEGYTVDANYHGVFHGEHRFVSDDGHVLSHDGRGWHESHDGGHHGDHHSGQQGPRFAYTEEERNQWLSDCQFLMADAGGYDDDDDVDEAFLGGLIGAVGGGILGNRIADDDRLLGTVVGAGLGGLAGAAIGSILDSDGDGDYSRNEIYAARYCDAYLRRHELGGGEWAYGQQVMLVPVSGHRNRRSGCNSCGTTTTVTEEEWVEVEEHAHRPRRRARHVTRRAEPAPAPVQRGKRLRAD